MAIFKNTFSRLSLAFLLLSSPFAIAAPAIDVSDITIVKRAAGTEADPHDARFNIDGWESIAEQDCYIMLCVLGGRRV
jgi:hypothetical protein